MQRHLHATVVYLAVVDQRSRYTDRRRPVSVLLLDETIGVLVEVVERYVQPVSEHSEVETEVYLLRSLPSEVAVERVGEVHAVGYRRCRAHLSAHVATAEVAH